MSGRFVMIGDLPWWIRAQVRLITWLGWRPKWARQRVYREWEKALKSRDPEAIAVAKKRLFPETEEPVAVRPNQGKPPASVTIIFCDSSNGYKRTGWRRENLVFDEDAGEEVIDDPAVTTVADADARARLEFRKWGIDIGPLPRGGKFDAIEGTVDLAAQNGGAD